MISTDKLIEIQEASRATASKHIFFFLGLNATVLGFLFSQAILGNLNGLGAWMVVAWVAFGACFLIDILTAWSAYHVDILIKTLFIKRNQYSDVINNNREECIIAFSRPFTKFETTKILNEINDAEFLDAQAALETANKKFSKAIQKWYLKYSYPVFVAAHILVYTLSICIGISLINSRSDTPLKEKPQPVEQSALEISLAPEVLQVLKNLSEKVDATSVVPHSSPSQAQPSLAPESNPGQNQKLPRLP